ncbi:hypothetical protein [Anabaena sp. AL93]|uniref:hypothetical protein n=1 Tax=Anabaena sp. AL93 TaxID=1678133 RepID=UPI0007FE5604|nr:hypothetical protein [Anabaena sp. AL93]OBQ18621.1 MAG: hypothetical protein AN486_11570 [Anabaena sp. AL93]
MEKYPINKAKQAFTKALTEIPDFALLSPSEKGNIVDRSIKCLFEELMQFFGLNPNQDYIPLDQLPGNKSATDFLVSHDAQELLEGLFEGKLEIVKPYTIKLENGTFISGFSDVRKVVKSPLIQSSEKPKSINRQ